MDTERLAVLRTRIADAPTEPGIYRWLDEKGTVLYVGKAKNLRNRLRSYVQKDAAKNQGPWKVSLYHLLADFDVTITNTELEALLLETNLIKQLRPKYNVLMKDDKNYVYLKVTLQDAYPRVEVVRRMDDDGAKYFGPFLKAYELYRMLDMLQQILHYRACKHSIDTLNRSPAKADTLKECLEHQIGQCNGLCAGVVSREEYRRGIEDLIAFFRGDYDPVEKRARELMQQAAAERKFEKAAELRNALHSIEMIEERQLVSDTSFEDMDVIGVALLSGKAQVILLRKRGGKLLNDYHLSLQGQAEDIGQVLSEFLPQYYEGAADIPDTILVCCDFADRAVFEEWMTQKRGKKVRVVVPERGKKSQLLDLAQKNAEEKAKQSEAKWEAEARNTADALASLAQILKLSSPPKRIECYDISHLGGTETVGSMVVFKDGKPHRDHYRTFTIHTMKSGDVDDYRALGEVLTRRLRHRGGGIASEEAWWSERGISFGRAKKADGAALAEIIHDKLHNQTTALSLDEFFVVRKGEKVVGIAQLHEHSTKLLELHNVWVERVDDRERLRDFLVRKILRSVKKGKIYAVLDQEEETIYGGFGFRHVLKEPKVLQDEIDKRFEEPSKEVSKVIMVYDMAQHKEDASLSHTPDLLVIDGGKGQLGVAVEVLARLELSIPAIGLAKREEEVFISGKSDAVSFPNDSPAKFLLMRLRDEAHRFANRHREKRGAKKATLSALDTVPGIGEQTKKQLLGAFGDIDAIRGASDEALKQYINGEQLASLRRTL